jgi:hypothetical protein
MVSANVLPASGGMLLTLANGVYMIINVSISLTGSKPVYKVLSWRDTSSAYLVVGCVGAITVMYYVLSCLGQIRDQCCLRRCGCGSCTPRCCPRRMRMRALKPSSAGAAPAPAPPATGPSEGLDGWFPAVFLDGPVAAYPCLSCCNGCRNDVAYRTVDAVLKDGANIELTARHGGGAFPHGGNTGLPKVVPMAATGPSAV